MRTSVFMVLEEVTAGVLEQLLSELSADLTDQSATTLSVERHSCGPLRQVFDPLHAVDHRIIIVTERHAEWLIHDMHTDVHRLYVRPGLLAAGGAPARFIGAIQPITSSERTLPELDALLSHLPTISMEQLHAADVATFEWLAKHLGTPLRTQHPAEESGRYHDALAALLSRPPSDAVPRSLCSGRWQVALKKAGLAMLDRGWSFPEAEHVWTEGRHARLLLPVGCEDGRVDCRLEGFMLLQAQHPISVRVRVEGLIVAEVSSAGLTSPYLSIDFSVRAQPGARLTVLDLQIDRPIRPSTFGVEDDRLLGFGLQAVHLGTRSARQAAPDPLFEAAPAKRLLKSRSYRRILVIDDNDCIASVHRHWLENAIPDAVVMQLAWEVGRVGGAEQTIRRSATDDLVVLGTRDIAQEWLAAVKSEAGDRSAGADLIIGSEPSIVTTDLLMYAEQVGGRIETDGSMCTVRGWTWP